MAIPEDVIDDLCSRFIINIPQEERKDLIRVCFHIELAHWFYIDYYCTENAQLPKVQFKEFARIVFQNIPFLQQHQSDLDGTIERWRDYKMAVPTYGAILLDKELDHVLLVQGFWARSSWGFPKGKVNADEDPVVCACREVLEETGYDCSAAISAKDYIELHIQDTLIRLYIVTGVDMATVFKPMTRCEIKNCNWFRITDLPVTRKDNVKIENKALKPSAFFMTIPFIKPLRKWISRRRRSLNLLVNGSIGDIEIDMDCSAVIEEAISSVSSAQHPSHKPSQHQHQTPHQQKHRRSQKQQQQPQQQQPKQQQPRFWSNTWQHVKIDWTELMREFDQNNNDSKSSNNIYSVNKLLAIHS